MTKRTELNALFASSTNCLGRRLWGRAGLVALLLSSMAWAQTPASDLFKYTVQKGDRLGTLLGSVVQLPNGPERALKDLQGMNTHVDLHNLRAGQNILIPNAWLQARANLARVTQLQCSSRSWPEVANPETKQLNLGDEIGEGSLLRVPSGCQVMLTLEDGSRIQLPSGAVMEITSLRTPKVLNAPQVRLKLHEGRVGLDIFNKRPANSVFEIQTPMSLAGVRGTQFRVGYESNLKNSTVEVLQGEVKNQGQGDNKPSILPKGTGQRVGATGAGEPPQILPLAPAFERYDDDGRMNAGQLRFAASPDASAYAWRNTVAVNQFGVAAQRSSLALNLRVASLGSRAQAWHVSSIERSGLQGLENSFALCHTEGPAEGSYCSVAFDTSSFSELPMRLVLYRVNVSGEHQPVLRSERNGPVNGSLWLGALPPGLYFYELSHLPAHKDANNLNHWVTQAGQFQLINVNIWQH